MQRIIFHIDVNNAFLSWSALELLKSGFKIDIRTIPAVVGGDEKQRKGVVLAKSMPAKKKGIVTGEPIYLAKRKVDKLFVTQGCRESYKKYSDAFYSILCNYTPNIERYSIDECFLDMTGTEKLFGNPIKLAYKIKDEIKEKLGFTVNVGIGNSKVCAKMASDFEKPDKVHTLFRNEIKDKLWPLNVDDLFMIGKKTSIKLHELGIHKIEDLANTDINLLVRHFKSAAYTMHDFANGIDESNVEKHIAKNKGIGHSVTVPEDLETISDTKKVLYELSSMVGKRLRVENKYATTIAVQLKNSEFISYIHQKKVTNPICSDEDIYEVSCELLKAMWKGDYIRLVGVRVTDLTDNSYEQISLFENPGKLKERDKVQKTLDEINKKFGKNIIKRAASFEKK